MKTLLWNIWKVGRWAIAAFVKPWQAPDVNYFIVKIPKKLEFDKDESVDIDDADKGTSKRNMDALIDYMTADYMKRKKSFK